MSTSWNYTKIHSLELQALATATTRTTKKKDGTEKTISSSVGGLAFAVYVCLRGRTFSTNIRNKKFFCWISHQGIAQDLGWDLKDSRQRITNAVRQLVEVGAIRKWSPTEWKAMETIEPKLYKEIGFHSTTVYELSLFKVIWEEGGFFHTAENNTDTGEVSLNSGPPEVELTGGLGKTNREVSLNSHKEKDINNKKKEKHSIINNERKETLKETIQREKKESEEELFRDWMEEDYEEDTEEEEATEFLQNPHEESSVFIEFLKVIQFQHHDLKFRKKLIEASFHQFSNHDWETLREKFHHNHFSEEQVDVMRKILKSPDNDFPEWYLNDSISSFGKRRR